MHAKAKPPSQALSPTAAEFIPRVTDGEALDIGIGIGYDADDRQAVTEHNNHGDEGDDWHTRYGDVGVAVSEVEQCANVFPL